MISPEQVSVPVVLSMVQPVSVFPPAISTSPSDVLAICTRPVVPASSVRLVPAPVDMAPVPAKPMLVAEKDMVSIEETDVSAPESITIPFIVSPDVGALIA